MVVIYRQELKVSLKASLRVTVSNIKRKNPQVLVATPGRLIDLVENYGLDISTTKFKILDEGDKMLDMGFQQELS